MQFNKQPWEVTPKGAGVLKAKHAASASGTDGNEQSKLYYQKHEEIETAVSQEWSDQEMLDQKQTNKQTTTTTFYSREIFFFLSEHKYERGKRDRNEDDPQDGISARGWSCGKSIYSVCYPDCNGDFSSLYFKVSVSGEHVGQYTDVHELPTKQWGPK